jgi:hypothetical protein
VLLRQGDGRNALALTHSTNPYLMSRPWLTGRASSERPVRGHGVVRGGPGEARVDADHAGGANPAGNGRGRVKRERLGGGRLARCRASATGRGTADVDTRACHGAAGRAAPRRARLRRQTRLHREATRFRPALRRRERDTEGAVRRCVARPGVERLKRNSANLRWSRPCCSTASLGLLSGCAGTQVACEASVCARKPLLPSKHSSVGVESMNCESHGVAIDATSRFASRRETRT